jgi:sterol desaturase/sphingolipid hydroxylase (fatty acid hydroxylase superfamily)
MDPGMSPPLQFALGLAALHTLTFLAVSGFFALLFRGGIATRYQVASGQPPDAALGRAALREVVVAHLFFPAAVYLAVYPLWVGAGGSMATPAPPLWTFALHLVAFIAINDTIFYWSHRLLHTRWLFRKVHYRHHRFRIVRGVSAEFAHPLESLFNFIALFAGPVLLATPFPVFAVWMVVRIAETVEAHSGYMLSPVSSRHAFHHLHAQRGCFGSFVSLWDALLGTDRNWREWRKSQQTVLPRAAE